MLDKIQKIKTGESHNDLIIINTSPDIVVTDSKLGIKKTKQEIVCDMVIENDSLMCTHFINGDYRGMFEIWCEITKNLIK